MAFLIVPRQTTSVVATISRMFQPPSTLKVIRRKRHCEEVSRNRSAWISISARVHGRQDSPLRRRPPRSFYPYKKSKSVVLAGESCGTHSNRIVERRIAPSAPTAQPRSLSFANLTAFMALPCGKGFCQRHPFDCAGVFERTEAAITS